MEFKARDFVQTEGGNIQLYIIAKDRFLHCVRVDTYEENYMYMLELDYFNVQKYEKYLPSSFEKLVYNNLSFEK